MNKKITLLILLTLLFTSFSYVKAADSIIISVNNNTIQPDNKATIYWNTNLEATCGIDYSINSDLSGGTGTNGSIIQRATATNDGKFHYVVNLNNLLTNTDYYYQVNCAIDNGPTTSSQIYKLSNQKINIQEISNSKILSDNSATIDWTTDQESSCKALYSKNANLDDAQSSSGAIFKTSFPEVKNYYEAKLLNLSSGVKYYYKIQCSLSSTNTSESGIFEIPAKVDAKSDLTIKDIVEIPAEIGIKGVRVKYSNIGQTLARINFKIKLKDNNSSYSSEATDSQPADFMANEERYKDFSLSNGTYNFIATIDSDNIISETNENNNLLEKTIVIGTVASNKINIYEVRSGGETKNSANIYFNTNGNYDCKIKYSNSENYGQSVIGKLVQSGTATNGGDFIYNNKLENLLINTKYFYKVVCTDPADNTKESSSYNFTTLADYADVIISDVNLMNLAGDAVKITWKTNINTSYNFIMLWDQNLTSGKSYNEETKYGTNHEVILTGLQKNTNYKYYAFARLYDGSSIGAESKYFDFSTTGSTDYQSTISSGDTNVTIIDKDNITNQGKAIMLSNDMLQPILTELKQLRDQVREQAAELKYLKGFASEMKALTSNMQSAIKTFITYGVDENTKKLGEGERAAVINSYEAAFDKLPQTEAELTNVIKIANGRFPSITSDKAEQQAKEQFYKIYNRVADMNNANDAAAIKVMAYGLRQKASNRNLNSEKTGIKTFKAIFGNNPKTTEEWNAMQAITYSGATKKTDSDKDGIADETENKLGTNPNKADSDGDGYKDGTEVLNGYDPLKK